MMLTGQTILITGGSSGIGFELARVLISKKNTVIICARDLGKLQDAKKLLPEVNIFPCDIAEKDNCIQLIAYVKKNFPSCGVLINNAAIAHKTNFLQDDLMIEKAEAEIKTNLMAPMMLAKLFLHAFPQHASSAIINITTGLVFTPLAVYPVYNATKSGLHAFTLVLREQLKKDLTHVIEVMMPVVHTPWHKGDVPSIAITPEAAVKEMIRKIEKGQCEVKVGAVPLLAILSRIAPRFAFKKINRI